MLVLYRIMQITQHIAVWTGRVAAWVALPLIFVIVFDVITRRFFVLGSTKLQDLEWHLHAVLFLFCLGFAYMKDAHVRIDLVREKLSERTKLWIELVGCLLFLIPYASVVIYYGEDWWLRSFMMDEAAESATGLPHRWIIKAALPIGFIVLLISAISMTLRKVLQLFGPPDVKQKVDEWEKPDPTEIEQLDDIAELTKD